ncbi:MAG TPA: hypothetical protein EYN97_08755 [Candidatus Lambdaproteobacteria bacterium]|nr:hypothetical protein [Candidatus Lambdaproteobacteria bacterium]
MAINKEEIRELPDIQKPLLLFKNLKTDLDKLKSQINNLNKVKLSSKLLRGISLKKGDLPTGKILEFTGSRLSQSLKNTRAKEISERLHKHPEDSKSRLELVEMFLQEAEGSSLQIARDAFLLVMQEVEKPMISTQKINMALTVQTIYFEKLKKFLHDDLTETESKIKGDGNVDTILEKQQQRLRGEVDFIQKCVELLKTEPISTVYELNLNKSKTENIIPFGDLKNGFDPMLRRLVFLPLAQENMELMFEILHRLESKNPLVGYHQAKMHDVLAQIQLVIASVVNEPEPRKKGFEQLSKAMKAIGGAVKLVGDIPEKAVEKAAVHRFGHLCYTIHRSYRSHDIPVPGDHLQRMQKAVSLLEPIAADPKIQKIQTKLLYVLSEEK